MTVLLDPGVTLTVDGSLSVGSGATVEVNTGTGTGGVPTGVTVDGGNLEASGATFVLQNPGVGPDPATLQVQAGQLFLTGSQFSWNQLTLAAGAGGAVYSNTFASTLSLSSAAAADVSLNDFSSPSTTVVASGSAGTTISLPEEYRGTTNSSIIEAKITDSHTNNALPAVAFPQPLASPLAAAATSTSAGSASVPFSQNATPVTLTADVTSPAGTVDGWTLAFTVLDARGNVVSQPLGATVAGGIAGTAFTLPAGQASGQYTVLAVYNGDSNYQGSVSVSPAGERLTVNGAATTTTAANLDVSFGSELQFVTLNATVTSGGAGVNDGTVTFTVLADDGFPLGIPVTSGNLSAGNASATFALPAAQATGTYAVEAVYNPGPEYQGSSDATHTLTVGQAATTLVMGNTVIDYAPGGQVTTLSATVAAGSSPVVEGTVTFVVYNAAHVQIGPAVTSSPLATGTVNTSFPMPTGLAPGSYSVDAVYSPGPDYLPCSDSSHLLIDLATKTTTTVATSVSAGSARARSRSLSTPWSTAAASGSTRVR